MSIEITRTLRCDFPDCWEMFAELDHVAAPAVMLRALAAEKYGYEVNGIRNKDFCAEHASHRKTKTKAITEGAPTA